MLRALLAGIFVGDVNWAWRRRVAVCGGVVMLAGILNSTFWDPNLEHARMVMEHCQTGFLAIMTIYVAGACYDDHSKRRAGEPVSPEAAH